MMFALLATLLMQPQTVTFEHPCARAEVVLEALGRQTGLTLKPSGSVNQDYFLVRFEDAPLQEALDRIAKTLNATWTEQGGVRYLGRTHAQELADAKAEKDADIKLITDWLAKREIKEEYTSAFAKKLIDQALPLMKTDGTDPKRYESLQALDAQSPAHRFLARIIKEIGIERFADLGPDDQMTYALEPNSFQRRLPNGEALRLFERENTIHKAVVEQMQFEEDENGGYYSDLVSPYRHNYYNPQDETSLTVSRNDMFLTVTVYVKGGGYARDSISGPRNGQGKTPDLLAKMQDRYEPTELEKELAATAMVLFGGQREGKPTISTETVAKLQDPVANDPLTMLGSRWMIECSRALGRNLVAMLSDEMYVLSIASIGQGMNTYGGMWSMISQLDKEYEFTVDDKWIGVAPGKRVQTRKERIDREKWRSLIRSGRPGQAATLEQYASYAALSDNQIMVLVAMIPAALAGQALSIDFLNSYDNLDALRLYGMLTAVQQKQARAGVAEVPLNRLDARGARSARRIVFGQYAAISKDRLPQEWREPNVYYGSREENKPDKLLGGGAPNGSIVRFQVVQQDLLFPRPPGEGYSRGSGMTAESFGTNKAMTEVYPQEYSMDFGFVAMSKVDQLIVEFEFPGVGWLYKRVQSNNLPQDVVYGRVSELPKDVRDKIEETYKKSLEQYKKSKGGGGGG